jgi:hypothetical protein
MEKTRHFFFRSMTVDVLARHRLIVGPFAHGENGKLGLRHVWVSVSRPAHPGETTPRVRVSAVV